MANNYEPLSDADFYKRLKVETRREITNKVKDQIDDISDDYPDPDDFKRKLIRFSNAIKEVGNAAVGDYVRAVYFCSLYAQNYTQVDAYCKVWPERAAKKSTGTSTLANSASSYFNGDLVQAIWKQVNVADHMLFVDKRFKAYQVLEDIMDHPDSTNKEKIEAAGKLITNLQPPKEAKIKVDVGYQSQEIKALEEKLLNVAKYQVNLIETGQLSNKDVVEAEIIDKEEKEDEVFDIEIHDAEVYEKYGIIVRRLDAW